MKTYNTFMHTEVGPGRATLAIKETTEEGKTPIVEVAVAWCAPNEQFNRRTGRSIASGRLNAKRRHYTIAERDMNLNIKKQAEKMFAELINGTRPSTIANLPAVSLPRWLEENAG